MRIILDTDPGIDDAVAVFYLAAQPGVEIAAVGTVHGNATAEIATRNALGLMEFVGRSEVPVAHGAALPLAQPLHVSDYVHGGNGMGDIEVPWALEPPVGAPVRGAVDVSAAEQMVRLARAEPGAYDLLALGPLTNVALALQLEPRLPALLRRVVVMGGAISVPGNISPYGEANVWHDPEAADLVLAAGFDLTLVPLDATLRAIAEHPWLQELAGLPGDRARLTSRFLEYYVDFYTGLLGRRGCAMHDPLAAAVLLRPELATTVETQVRVELRGGYTRGMTVADLRSDPGTSITAPPVKVVTHTDVPWFLDRLMTALRG
ncbi:nucleoside hydrolase [Allonocardiopsis opalescens]|uniref:Purine nucleosidase n=1 Tax=Allonocardiopsis opalescens TaxID=1144618 RepID=A0A2T0Q898_9ACTN|nr:nucleoside hydrolase [Allonocardiopsis opalescens]PRY00078.1 purine nucleosidase [Allonocardiopsis opalescens]